MAKIEAVLLVLVGWCIPKAHSVVKHSCIVVPIRGDIHAWGHRGRIWSAPPPLPVPQQQGSAPGKTSPSGLGACCDVEAWILPPGAGMGCSGEADGSLQLRGQCAIPCWKIM